MLRKVTHESPPAAADVTAAHPAPFVRLTSKAIEVRVPGFPRVGSRHVGYWSSWLAYIGLVLVMVGAVWSLPLVGECGVAMTSAGMLALFTIFPAKRRRERRNAKRG
jgi:hypothetical protein